MKVTRYPRNADGTPMDLLVGVVTDDTGNGGARLTTPPTGPDDAPIDAKAIILVGSDGQPASLGAGAKMLIATFAAIASTVVPPTISTLETVRYAAAEVTGGAKYVEDTTLNDASVAAFPMAITKSFNGRYFRILHEYGVNVDQFGARQCPIGTTTYDVAASWLACKNYLNLKHVNGGNGYFGVPIIDWPAGHYYSTIEIEPSDTGIVQGAGSGWAGPGGFGATCISFGPGVTAGMRSPFPNTSGNTTTGVATHNAPGGLICRGFRLVGPYVYGVGMAEAEVHGLVMRGIGAFEDFYITNFPGDGVVGLAGTIWSMGSAVYGGNTSCSTLTRIHCANNRWGFKLGGTDGNIINGLSLWAYTNRQGGIYDDNGAGSNGYDNIHTAGNGLATDGHGAVRVHHLGNLFQVKPLRHVQASTNSPPATLVDDVNYYSIETGFPDATCPDWFNGILLRWGFDYYTTDTAGVVFNRCYQEGNGFSHFGPGTVFDNGTLPDRYTRGGHRTRIEFDGHAERHSQGATAFVKHFDCGNGAYVGMDFRAYNPTTFINDVIGTFTFTGGYGSLGASFGGFFLDTLAGGAPTHIVRLDYTGAWITNSSFGYGNGGGTVVQPTDKTTAFTLNKVCGHFTMNGAALAAGAIVTPTFNNSFIGPDDRVSVWIKSGVATPGTYRVSAEGNASGARTIVLENRSAGPLSEAVVVGFTVHKDTIT